jgi:ferredoxin
MYEAEHKGLAEWWEEEYQKNVSRLACQITLQKEHDGLIVLVPDPLPTDIL